MTRQLTIAVFVLLLLTAPSGDPLLAATVVEGSGLGDLAGAHDRYLYAREGQEPAEG